MVSPNVSRVLEETRRLSLEERRQLLALLSTGENQAPSTDAELDEMLIRSGIVFAVPSTPTAADTSQSQAWQPVAIRGKPLSETIIEERR